MVRKTKDEAEKTRRLILEKAQNLFYERGVVRTSLQQIAQKAGVTRGAVYWHFRDKVDLLHTIVDESFLPQEALVEQLATIESDEPIAVLRENCLSKLKDIAHDPVQRRVFTILIHRCEHMDEIRAVIDRSNECRQKIRVQLMRIFEKASEKGQLNPLWTPRVAADALQHLIFGYVQEEMEWPAPAADRDESRGEALSAFFKTLECSNR